MMNDDENKVVEGVGEGLNQSEVLNDKNIENLGNTNTTETKTEDTSNNTPDNTSKKEKRKKDKKSDENNDNDEEEFGSSKNSIAKEIVNWVITIIACIIIAKMINSFVIVNARVPSASMENTIMTNDRLIANRLAYVFSEPEKGDIVVFEAPDEPDKLFIKRVIGVPGDLVQIHDGLLYINNELQDEPYIKEDMVGSFGPYTVPEDNYFMLGDNRNNSLDARYWRNTYVPEDTILGKAMFTYYPEIHVIK